MQRKPAEVFPPGEYIADELEALGWSQVQFAEVLGVSDTTVSEIIKGRRSLTPEMAKALEAALGQPAEYWLGLDAYFRLHNAPEASPAIAKRAKLYGAYPVRDMIYRRWLEASDNPEVIAAQVTRYFEIRSLDDRPALPNAARRGGTVISSEDLTPIQWAWLYRVKHLAEDMPIMEYSEGRLRNALEDLRALTTEPEEVRHVPRILAECGVRFVAVEPLAGSKTDGVCFWLTKGFQRPQPVIGMTLRLDRIDNFWFTLRHEIEHVLRRDMSLDENLSEKKQDIPEQERAANEAAAEFCVPSVDLDDFIMRVKPLFSERRILAFAQRLQIHPGIVIGQLQRRLDRYDLLRKHLVGIRAHVAPYALTDGYGQQLTA
jgi:HTH-type transcriptional regulator/antitoxin HigA